MYSNQGHYEKALEWLFKALAVFENLPIYNYGTPTVYHNIGDVYYAQEEYDKALEYFSKAVMSYKEDHPNIAVTCFSIADVCAAQGKYDKALELYVKAYTALVNEFGLEHQHTKSCYENMRETYTKTSLPDPFSDWLTAELAQPN